MGFFSRAVKIYMRAQKQKERARLSASIRAGNLIAYINARQQYIPTVKSVKSISTQFDMIFDRLQRLKEIEVQYPKIVSPSADELFAKYRAWKNVAIRDFVIGQVDLNIEKAKAITRKPSKITLLDKSIIQLIEAKNCVEDVACIEVLSRKENEIKGLIQEINPS